MNLFADEGLKLSSKGMCGPTADYRVCLFKAGSLPIKEMCWFLANKYNIIFKKVHEVFTTKAC